MNRIQLLGRLGADPELSQLQSGTQYMRIRVATTEPGYTTQTGLQLPERTTWHSVTLWGKMAAAAANFLQKGSRVYVEGTLHSSEIEKNGEKRTYWNIDATICEFLSHLKPRMSEDAPPPSYTENLPFPPPPPYEAER